MDLSTRNRQAEVMDDPAIDEARLKGALDGLRRINFVTQTARLIWPDIKAAADRHPGQQLRVLDVGCGGGDTLVALWRRARAAGLGVTFHGCDISPIARTHATEFAQRAGVGDDITFSSLDVFKDTIPDDFDVILCTLFLHHLPDDDAVRFLANAAHAARDRVVVQDLVRGPFAYAFAAVGVRALLCNDVCRVDGPRSVEGAFTPDEAAALAERAGLQGATVEPRFPFRYILRWVRP